jgi:hypothetical protein
VKNRVHDRGLHGREPSGLSRPWNPRQRQDGDGTWRTSTTTWRALDPGRRYSIIAGAAILVPTLAYLIGGLGFGTYEGSFGTILAFIGVAAL